MRIGPWPTEAVNVPATGLGLRISPPHRWPPAGRSGSTPQRRAAVREAHHEDSSHRARWPWSTVSLPPLSRIRVPAIMIINVRGGLELRAARRPTPPWIVGLGRVRQLGFSSTAPLVLPVALATIWPLLLIAVASWIVGDPAGIRVLRFCTVPPLSMYGPPTITPLSLIAAGLKLPRSVMVPLL